jgi:hypothetical protein
MSKPVPPEVKRIIISARVTPQERETLVAVGEGNISRGLDRIMVAWSQMTAQPQPAAATLPSVNS